MENSSSYRFPAIERALSVIKARNAMLQNKSQSSDHIEAPEDVLDADQPPIEIEISRPSVACAITTERDLASVARELQHKSRRDRTATTIQNSKSIKYPINKQGIALSKALKWCGDWKLMQDKFNRLYNYYRYIKSLRVRFRQHVVETSSRIVASAKFTRSLCVACVRRLGKMKLAVLFDTWRLKRKYFICWLHVLTARM